MLPNAYAAGYYGLSDFDRTHVLVLNYIYELPVFRGGNSITHKVLGGWEVSGVNLFQSGVPLSVRTNADIAGIGTGSGNQFWTLAGDTSTEVAASTNSANWFNPAAFTIPATGTYGTQLHNHPNWSNPVTDPTNGSFGKVTGKTNDDRRLQLALKYIF